MTNEKHKEEARELLGAMFRAIREIGYREPPLTLLKETSDACLGLILKCRSEAVKAERERCANLAVEYCFRRGMIISTTCGAADKLHSAILSDDQEATPGKGQGGTCASCAKFGKCGRDSWCEEKEWEEGRG